MENTEILTNNSAAFIPAKRRCVTLDECSADWLNSLEGKAKKSTFDTYRNIYRRNISPVLGKKICEEITQNDAESVLEGPGINTANYRASVTTVLKMVLEYAGKNGHVTGADMRGRTSAKGAEDKAEFLSDAEYKRLHEAVTRDMGIEKAIIFLAMNTGLKCGELSALKRSDVDFKTGKLSVTKGLQRIYQKDNGVKTEGVILELNESVRRSIELPKFVVDTVKPLYKGLDGDCYLTTGRPDYVLPDAVHVQLRTLAVRCGLCNLSFITLRHTFAKRCVRVGIDAVDLAKILGIANVSRVVRLYYGERECESGRLLERLNLI